MDNTPNRKYHLNLISIYIFSSTFYSMSLQTRVCYDLGYICFHISSYNKELDALSNKELENRLSSITKPLWYDKYEYIKKRSERLLRILYLFPTTKAVDIIYEILISRNNKNKEKTLNKMQHQSLVFSYLHKHLKYSLPFRQRIEFNLGIVDYFLDADKELNILSEKELEDKMSSLKAPWWNKIYEIVLEDHTFLLAIVWLLLNPRIILRIFKSKEPQQ